MVHAKTRYRKYTERMVFAEVSKNSARYRSKNNFVGPSK